MNRRQAAKTTATKQLNHKIDTFLAWCRDEGNRLADELDPERKGAAEFEGAKYRRLYGMEAISSKANYILMSLTGRRSKS